MWIHVPNVVSTLHGACFAFVIFLRFCLCVCIIIIFMQFPSGFCNGLQVPFPDIAGCEEAITTGVGCEYVNYIRHFIRLCRTHRCYTSFTLRCTKCRRISEKIQLHHRPNGSSSPVLTATSLSYGKAKNSTPHRIKTPDPIEIKFGRVDYVGEGTRHAKFYANPSKGGFPANG